MLNEKLVKLLDFKVKFKNRLKEKLKELEERLTASNIPDNAALLKRFSSAVTHVLQGESSYTRPLLVFASCHSFNVPEQIALELSVCGELIHNMSLIIDDLPSMDNADFRRDRPTTHKVYGEASAILASLSLYTYALQILSNLASNNPNAQNTFFNYLQNVIRGQVIDIDLPLKEATEAKVDQMHILKTGDLIKACIVLPAQLSKKGINQSVVTALEKISDALGLGYQIRDDLLDAIAAPEELGKPTNSDVANNKPSYVLLLGVEHSISKMMTLFTGIFKSIQEIEMTDNALNLEFLKFIIEQICVKSFELKTFLPTQTKQLEQHVLLITDALKRISRTDASDRYFFHYAYGACFPIYAPSSKQLFKSVDESYVKVEAKVIEFVSSNKLYLSSTQHGDNDKSQPPISADDSRYRDMVEQKKWQDNKLGILTCLATSTPTFSEEPSRLQLLADFKAYLFLLTHQLTETANEKPLEFYQQILACFQQEFNLNKSSFAEHSAATKLASRLKIVLNDLYENKPQYEDVTRGFLNSLSELFSTRTKIKPLYTASLSYDELSKHKMIVMGYKPIIRLTYVLLGIPNFHNHAMAPISKLEELVLEAMVKISDFLSLRSDLYHAGFGLAEIGQLYTTNQPLHSNLKLPNNLLVLRALQNKCSLQQAIFQELAEYSQLIDRIGDFINRHGSVCSGSGQEALTILQRWASFANPLWLLMNETKVGSHELVYRQFQALCKEKIKTANNNYASESTSPQLRNNPESPRGNERRFSWNIK